MDSGRSNEEVVSSFPLSPNSRSLSPPDSLPPIGQHALSITFDQDLLLYDDGFFSNFQMPPGENRTYSSPRKYQLDLTDPSASGDPGTATEVWNYEQDQSIL